VHFGDSWPGRELFLPLAPLLSLLLPMAEAVSLVGDPDLKSRYGQWCSYMATSHAHTDESCRVSSVLNKDVKQFGKQFLFDGSEETCWNSEQVMCSSCFKAHSIIIMHQFVIHTAWLCCPMCAHAVLGCREVHSGLFSNSPLMLKCVSCASCFKADLQAK
jgi:hypothetical protein